MPDSAPDAMPDAAWRIPAFDLPLWLGRRHAYCVVIPVINEGARLSRLLARMQSRGVADQADIMIVDGGSTDGSVDPARLSEAGVRGLIVKTGSGGLSAQLRCVYAHALRQRYEGIVTIDGNDKDDPEAISRMIDALESGVDFVQASRFIRGGIAENTPKAREIAIRWLHAPLISLSSGHRWTDTTQGFRAYSRRLLMDPRVAPFRDVFDTYELLAYLSCRAPRLGYRCIELPTARRYPAGMIPTKIGGYLGHLSVFTILVRACLGRFDP